MRAPAILFAAVMLAGCARQQRDAPATTQAAVPKAITRTLNLKPLCSQVRVYTDAESKALTDAAVALDADSILITALADYARMRAEARVCQAKN